MDASGATPGNPASMTARGHSHHCRSGAGSFSKQSHGHRRRACGKPCLGHNQPTLRLRFHTPKITVHTTIPQVFDAVEQPSRLGAHMPPSRVLQRRTPPGCRCNRRRQCRRDRGAAPRSREAHGYSRRKADHSASQVWPKPSRQSRRGGCQSCSTDVGISAHRPQHGQRHQDRGGHRLRTASGRATGLRPVRTQAATGRAGLSRPGVGHRACVASGRVGCAVAGAGDRVHRARDHDVRRGRLPGRRRADVRAGAHRSGRRHLGRRTTSPSRCAFPCWRAGVR